MENTMNASNRSHHYHREVSLNAEDSLAYLARSIPAGSTVLELGPAMGYFSAYLHDNACVVDAIEFDAAMAEVARPFCRDLVVGDLDTLCLEETFSGRRYDFVVLADVLEHLRFPEKLLAQLANCLLPKGQVLISVPNVAYAGLVLDLLDGQFMYGDEGLLDRTHVHFYTQSSLNALFVAHGFYAHAWWAVRKTLHDSEFNTRLEKIPPAVVAHIAARPDSMAYQWVAAFALDAPSVPPAVPVAGLPDQFPLRLFWQTLDDETFSYEKSSVVWGKVGELDQTLSLKIPEAATKLRLRLADRVGFVVLKNIISYHINHEVLAEWNPSIDVPASTYSAMLFVPEKQGFVLQSEDSWLEVPCAFMSGARLDVCVSWPMSADYEAAITAWQMEIVTREQTIADLKNLVAERDDWLVARQHLLEQKDTAISLRDTMIVERDAWLSDTQAELARVAKAWQDDANAYQAMVSYRDALVTERERVIVERDAQLSSRTAEWEAQKQILAHQAEALAERMRWSWLWRLPLMRWRLWRSRAR